MGLTFGLAVLAAIIAAIFRAEYDACMPWLAERLRRRALRAFKGTIKERLDEEWAAHLQEVPSPLLKVWHGLGFVVAGAKVRAGNIRTALWSNLLGIVVNGSIRIAKLLVQAGTVLVHPMFGEAYARTVFICLGRPAFALIGLALSAQYTRIKIIDDDTIRQRSLEVFVSVLQQITIIAAEKPSPRGEERGPWG